METHPQPSQPPGLLRKLAPYAFSFMVGVVALAAMLGGYAWENKFVGKTALNFFARTLGFDYFLEHGASKAAALRAVPGRYFREVDTPRIVLDIKFEHWAKILAKRTKALAIGNLIQEEGDFVPASIRYSDAKTSGSAKVKVRLKGDMLDHLEGKKWSFRVRTKGKDHVYGMRRFSLQKAVSRNYQLTPMMLALTKSLGLITARYFFVDLTINGNHIGTMALEEHPAKELLEASGRKESVILRYSERHYYNALQAGTRGSALFKPFDDHRLAPIDAFQSARIAKSPTLTNNYRVAAGLMRAFSDGRIPPSQAFDAELMGRFLAVLELFGSWHGVRWNNVRYYFNPQTALLEPVPFDMTSHLAWGSILSSGGDLFVRTLINDENIHRAYLAHLKTLIADVRSGELTKLLKKAEARHLPRLQKEYLLLGNFPMRRLVKRATMLKRRILDDESAAPKRYNQLVLARDFQDGDRRTLEVFNATLAPVIIERVHLGNCKGAATGGTEAVAANQLPLRLPPANPAAGPQGVSIELIDGLAPNCALMVDSHIAGKEKIKTVSADTEVLPRIDRPIPESDILAALADRHFLIYHRADNELRIAAGDHTVGRDIVVPAGTTLAIGAGTTLRFAPGVAIVAHGPLAFRGNAEAPITLRPADTKKGWQGIAVMRAGARSALRHTRVIHTTGVVKPGWSLTGGLTFYESDVDIVATTFKGHNGEDALNIVRSDFVIDGTTFDTTLSDAFDSDFSTGRITKSAFINIGTAGGGDAVDTSGSVVEITDVTFRRVSDKAISVGEASTVTVRGADIDDIGTGLASKDRSTLKASKVSIKNVKFAALTAYIKKPEYGGATIIADDISIEGGNTRNLVQNGSRIVLAGRTLDTQDIDIDALYDTVMKPGAR